METSSFGIYKKVKNPKYEANRELSVVIAPFMKNADFRGANFKNGETQNK